MSRANVRNCRWCRAIRKSLPFEVSHATSIRWSPAATTDHPRGCGDDTDRTWAGKLMDGPPPWMRGRLYLWVILFVIHRTTPAGAGTTRGLAAIAGRTEDHPRGVRGRRRSLRRLRQRVRTTCGDDIAMALPMIAFSDHPRAGAGTTPWNATAPTSASDHPRGRGDDEGTTPVAHTTGGPPPRVRGRRHYRYPCRRRLRTTPAGGGDDCWCSAHVWDYYGPPPRPRGRRWWRRIRLLQQRTTPAGAGTT
jgi:hypothetical protein